MNIGVKRSFGPRVQFFMRVAGAARAAAKPLPHLLLPGIIQAPWSWASPSFRLHLRANGRSGGCGEQATLSAGRIQFESADALTRIWLSIAAARGFGTLCQPDIGAVMFGCEAEQAGGDVTLGYERRYPEEWKYALPV